ncbi:MAG: hypothetical protein WC807_21115 [Hyphomicrobium sp.]|jgi:hypothetical protein
MANGFQGPPAVDFYNALSGLGDTLTSNRKVAREQQLRDAFRDGLPRAADGAVDYAAIGNILSQNGADIGTLLTVGKLGEDQRLKREEFKASGDFRSTLGSIFGGAGNGGVARQPVAQPQPSQPSPLPMSNPDMQSRAPVQPSAKVWGDKEAEDAGLYEPAAPKKMVSFGEALGGKSAAAKAALVWQMPETPPGRDELISGARADASARASTFQPQAKPAQAGFQGVTVEHVPALVQALANPRLPATDRDLAGKFLMRALDEAKEPEKIRSLQILKERSGYPGTILQLEMEMRRSSKTDVTVDQRGENEEVKAAGKSAGERRGAMIAAANSATGNLASLTRVQTLLDQIDQGKLAPSRMSISAWAKSFGVNDDFAKSLGLDPKKVGDAQAVQSLVNELVIGKLGPGGFPSNNFSDADRSFLTDIFPKLGNDPRANKILIETAKRVHNDNIQRALEYQSWKEDPSNKGRGFEDFELRRAKTISQMDRFGDLRKQAETLLQSAPTTQGGNAGGIQWSIQ